MSNVRERYNPVPMGANGVYQIKGNAIAGFLAKVSGTITVTGKDASGVSDVTFVDAVPVTAGLFTRIPLEFPSGAGGTVTLATNAEGTLFI